MTETPKTLAEEAEVNEILRKKTGVMIAIPNLGSKIVTPLMMWIQSLDFKTIDAECPYFFKVFMPNDLHPIEWARNQCVRAFLADPYWKKLWFVDADMNPPFNALDLLDFDAPLVSGMTYIWSGEKFSDDGFYVPPFMKINAFDYRPDHDDFRSRLPSADGKTFECDASGAACLVIRRDVLETMPEPWFRSPRDPYGATLRGEDLDFGLRAMKHGHKTLYVPRVQFGHLKEADLKQICTYGIATGRSMLQALDKLPPEQVVGRIKEVLDKMNFPGERPAEVERAGPKTLEVIQGGRR